MVQTLPHDSLKQTPEAAPGPEPLDLSGRRLGMGRSTDFPFQQWRDNDEHRTVFFDEGQGRTLVFVHGMGGNATHFEFIAAPLADRYRVVGLDLVGMGWSNKPKRRYDLNLLSDHLLHFLDRRGIERAVLVGHSLGGAVCLSTALQKPGLVDGLVLLCAAGVARVPLWMRAVAPLFLNRYVLYPFLRYFANFIVRNVFVDGPENNPHVAWFRETAMRDDAGYPNLKDFARVSASLGRDVASSDFSAQLDELLMPVLAIWGDHDKLTAVTRVLKQLDRIERIRTVMLKDTGHMPMIEHPNQTLEHVERFLERPPSA